VVGEGVDDAAAAGSLVVPAVASGIRLKVLDVVELAADGVSEFRPGDEVSAGLSDVGIRARAGGLVAGSVAVRDAGLEHFAVQPGDLVRDDGLADRGLG